MTREDPATPPPLQSAQRTVSFRLPSRFSGLFDDPLVARVWSFGLLAAGIVSLFFQLDGVGAAFIALGLVMTALTMMPTVVVVGADGLETRWLRWSRFLPYEAIQSVERHTKVGDSEAPDVVRSRGVLCEHRDGETYLVCEDGDAGRLVAAVHRRLERHRAAAAAELVALHRGPRTVEDWMKSLRALLGGGEGYRGPSTSADALWSILENPKSSAADRAAAALALRSDLGEQASPRLRVAIDTCASPKLRVALEAIDEDDEQTTGTSLERLARSADDR